MSTQEGRDDMRTEKLQGPSGLIEASGDTAAAARQGAKEFTTTAKDVDLGSIGAFDDAEYMRLVASIGASPGPFRRERRATSRGMESGM